MSKKIKFYSVSDRELLVNTCLVLLTMSHHCIDVSYKALLSKACLSLHTLVELMKIENRISV